MPDWFSAYCTSPVLPALSDVLEWAAENGCRLEITPDSNVDLSATDWEAAGVSYDESKLPFTVEVNFDDGSPDCIFRRDVDELRERLAEMPDSDDKSRVLRHLEETRYTLVAQIPRSTGDEGYRAVNSFLEFFERRCGGLVLADDGFYEGDKLILKLE